jgi:hypothetical protein
MRKSEKIREFITCSSAARFTKLRADLTAIRKSLPDKGGLIREVWMKI